MRYNKNHYLINILIYRKNHGLKYVFKSDIRLIHKENKNETLPLDRILMIDVCSIMLVC